ncbi:FAD/FMN-dependent dehydrogenase [Halovivax ruber XH-70]|uniref:D-lactate dehydrogenase (cytochrome) n=1 Tax=Halovivax ruber (strain DSM 18193 / JCM 13892 / XH-70) TaxID=797302 RepID=L0IAR0_HALRX|nr:FAD-binding and (Fe-S)-binding domain-containing protein [Halovivax ruber]AGB15824.1 FAD/FMN-dependent dehydrogenase [Halovivax ruber XH-70]
MATERGPAADWRATYDYRSETVERPALADAIARRIDGEVRMDNYSRSLYATDASAYEVTPIGVVFPRSTADVAAVMDYCAEQTIPVLPRGGGTSLAGQTVNRAVVLDFTRYMDEIVAIDADRQLATVQPGAILGRLNEAVEPDGLTFAPDPAWGDKSAIGGAIGNNSTGSHSLLYGKTDAYVESCEVVLADGTVTEFGEVTIETLEHRGDLDGTLEERIYATVARIVDEEADAIDDAYPALKRNVSGYNLDRLVAEARGSTLPGSEETGDPGTVNLARLLAGSEGTLAIVTEATVSLEPLPETKSVAMLCYRDLHHAMADVSAILEHDPAAVEVLDDVLIDLARETAEFGPVADRLPDGTNATLLVEFYADSGVDGENAVATLLADRCPGVEPIGTVSDAVISSAGEGATTGEPARAFDALEAHEPDERATLWDLRKSGLPILLSRTTDAKHISFIEDTAVPPARLPEFVDGFEAILESHDTYASFYAHAGPGVLHVRPLVNTKTEMGVDQFHDIADDVTELVVELGGSVSGEHGDGRARTQWNRRLYGDRVWDTFRELKAAFDPDWLLNPGTVCGYAEGEIESDGDGLSASSGAESAPPSRARTADMREHLRFDPDYEFEAGFEPTLEWDDDNGFQGMVELCHGCGGCRGDQSTTGGVMCPTYRASQEEITSTRGRANALRQAMSGELPDGEQFEDEFVEEVLDLCIGCKGCAVDCPSGVDMAKLKAEVTNEYHERHGVSLRDRLFANVHTLSAVGSRLAPLSNWASAVPGARWLLERTLGIDADRELPTFRRETFTDRFERRPTVESTSSSEGGRKALVFPDTYTNFTNPEPGVATVSVLEAAGVEVALAPVSGDSGRPAYSKGFLEQARSRAADTVDALAPFVDDGWDVVVIEPSDAVMLQSDYLDLHPGERTRAVAAATYGVCEYIDRFDLVDELSVDPAATSSITYHGHCHQKATKTAAHASAVLDRAGFDVDHLDSGCCGMAGSFGYEAEHASMSDAIGSILFEQVADSDGDRVVAPGASCRTQLASREPNGEEPPTPIEVLADALTVESSGA